jgi:hypothetical protein
MMYILFKRQVYADPALLCLVGAVKLHGTTNIIIYNQVGLQRIPQINRFY